MSMLFISHCTKNKEFAKELYERLVDQGYELPFLDSHAESGIEAGARWEQVLYERLKDCRALLVVCTNDWNESKWCFAELVYAKSMGKEVFPIQYEDCKIPPQLGAYQAISIHSEGEDGWQRLWKALEDRHLRPQDDFGLPADGCPYPGFPAFDEDYAGVFFGRDVEIRESIESLNRMRSRGQPRFLMIAGGSGTGKSSLMRAGVLPRLRRKMTNEWIVLPILRYSQTAGSGETLIDRLAYGLATMFPNDSRPNWKVYRDKFNGAIDTAVPAFRDATLDLATELGSPNATTLLAVDQFEELLAPSAENDADQFLEFLSAAFSGNSDRLLGIGTIRSDHLEQFQRHRSTMRSPAMQTSHLEFLPRERLAEVIQKPAERVHVVIEQELVQQLQCDAPTSDALPLLAFTLEKLFRLSSDDKLIQIDEYKAMGGMEGCISKTVQRALASIAEREQSEAIAEHADAGASDGRQPSPNVPTLSAEVNTAVRLSFVRYLSQASQSGKIVRRRANWKELPNAARQVLSEFVKERLLVKRSDDSVEVAHEAIFRCWEQLEQWLEDAEVVLGWRRDVERDRKIANEHDKKWRGLNRIQLEIARDWPARRPEDLHEEELVWIQKAKRQSLYRGIITGVVMLIVALAGVAYWQRSVALDNKRTSDANAAAATRQLTLTEIADANRIALTGRGGVAILSIEDWIHRPETDEEIRTAGHRILSAWSTVIGQRLGSGQAMRISADSKTLLVADTKHASYWDLATFALKNEIPIGGVTGGPGQKLEIKAISPDLQTAIIGNADGSSPFADTGPWNLVTGARVETDWKELTGNHYLSADGTRLLVERTDELVLVSTADWSRISSCQLPEFNLRPQRSPLTLSFDLSTAAFWREGTGDIYVFKSGDEFVAQEPAMTHPLDREAVLVGLLGPADLSYLLSVDSYGILRRWDTATKESTLESKLNSTAAGAVTSVVLSPDGKTLAVVWANRYVEFEQISELGSTRIFRSPIDFGNPITTMRFSADSTYFAASTYGRAGRTRLCDVVAQQSIGFPLLHDGKAKEIIFSPDKDSIVVNDGNANLWRISDVVDYGSVITKQADLVTMSKDGKRIVVAKSSPQKNYIEILRGDDYQQLESTIACPSRVWLIAISPDSKHLAYATQNRIFVVNLSSPEQRHPLDEEGMFDALQVMKFGDDSQSLLGVTIVGGQTMEWDTSGAQLFQEPLQLGDYLPIADASSDLKSLLVLPGTEDLLDSAARRRLIEQQLNDDTIHHSSYVNTGVFLDSSRVMLGGEDGLARIYDFDSLQPISRPISHGVPIYLVGASADGKTLFTFGNDGSLLVTDALTGAALGPLITTGKVQANWGPSPFRQAPQLAAMRPDGNAICAIDERDNLRLWKLKGPIPQDEEKQRLWIEVKTFQTMSEDGVRPATMKEWQSKHKILNRSSLDEE